MIIGIDISSIPYGTGVSEYTKQLVLNLLDIDKSNQYKLFFGSLRQSLPPDFLSKISQRSNAKLYKYPLPPTLLDILWNKLHILAIEFLIGKCDIFHTSDWTQPPTILAKTICTIHDLTPFLFPKWQHPIIISAHTKKINQAIVDKSNFISVSNSTKQDFYKLFKVKSHTIYESGPTNYKPTKEPSANYFLVSGTREPRKNLKNILLAFEQLQKKYPKSKLKIAGKYGWGQDIEPVHNVSILGYVSDSDLIKLHQNALALVYPSLYEGFGLPIAKSINCHVPVISSNISSMPEVVGKAGILIDPTKPDEIFKAMEQLIINRSLYTAISKECVSQSKKFSWKKTATQTLDFYNKIYDNRN